MMTARAYAEVSVDFEVSLRRLQAEVEAGAFDHVLADHLNYLESQLPEGYALNDQARVVRLDPELPDHVYVTSEINEAPSGRVRIPAPVTY